MILDLAELSGKNIFRRGKRSWLTIIGIVIGITAIVALFSLGQGLEDSVTREFEDLGANVIYVIPGQGVQGLLSAGGGLENSDLEAVRRVNGIDEAGPVVFTQLPAEFRDDEAFISVLGVPTDSSMEMVMRTNALVVDEGRNLRNSDSFKGLAGVNLQEGSTFDEEVELRNDVNIEDSEINIVGLLEPSGDPSYDRSIVTDIDTAREIVESPDRIDFIVAEVLSGQEPEDVSERIRQELRTERNQAIGEEDFTVSTADDLISSFLGILNTVQYVVIGIVSIALFVGGLGIMNTMYMSVNERTKEIGIMKAMGATRRQILGIFLIEAGALGIIGGVIGIALGMGISELAFMLIRDSVGIPLRPSRDLFLPAVSLVGSFFLGVFSGYLPARKAASLEPVEAIRQE